LPELVGKGIGQGFKALGHVQRAVQVKQHHPRVGTVVTHTARLQQLDQAVFALLEIGVGKGNDGLVQIRVVHNFTHINGKRVRKPTRCHR